MGGAHGGWGSDLLFSGGGCRCAGVGCRGPVRQGPLIALDRPVRAERFATEPGPLPRQRVVILDADRTRGSALRFWRGFGSRRGRGFVHRWRVGHVDGNAARVLLPRADVHADRSAEHTSALPSLMRTWYAVFCLEKKKRNRRNSTRAPKSI